VAGLVDSATMIPARPGRSGVVPRRSRALRACAAAAVAAALTFVAPLAVPGRTDVALGHSGLIAAVPAQDAAGDRVDLVFSEALESRFSGADIVDGSGAMVAPGAGRVEVDDPRVIVVTIPAAAPPGSLIAWRALSAADGHVTTGTIPLPVGEPSPTGRSPASRGHTAGHLSAEVIAKIITFGALLVALGLLPLGRLVVRPVTGATPPGFALAQASGLVIAGIGAAVLLAVTEQELVGAGEVVDPIAYVTGDRVGILLALRTLVPIVGGLAAALWIRRADPARGAVLAATAAAVTLVLTALSGHAAAYVTPIPMAVDVVHLGAGSVWLGGLVGLAGLIGSPTRPPPEAIRAMVPRFSALAAAATALLGLTGLYAAWLTTEDWSRLDSTYGLSLAIKVVLVAAAFGVGALNYLDGGRNLRIGGGLEQRIVLEAGMAFMVVVATAQLTSTDPPGLTRPVAIAPTSVTGPVGLALAPGRAGPNLIVVAGPVPVGAIARLTSLDDPTRSDTLELRSLDGLAGTAVERARVLPGAHVAATATIPGGRWEVAVALAGGGPAVTSFSFALDGTGLTAGRLAPPVPPPLLVAIGLLVLAGLAAAAYATRLRLPNIDPLAGRAALAGLTVAAAAAGTGILLVGPRV
jgi:copper transport protein